MIKSLIILVLLIIVLGGLALSRPSEESFKAYYRQRVAQQVSDVADELQRRDRAAAKRRDGAEDELQHWMCDCE